MRERALRYRDSNSRYGVELAVAAAANSAEAAGLVEALLLTLGAEETPVPQFTENAGPLHLRLETL